MHRLALVEQIEDFRAEHRVAEEIAQIQGAQQPTQSVAGLPGVEGPFVRNRTLAYCTQYCGVLSRAARELAEQRLEAEFEIAHLHDAAGFTHEKPKVEYDAGSSSCESSSALRGVAVAKLMSVVAEQAQLPERSHA